MHHCLGEKNDVTAIFCYTEKGESIYMLKIYTYIVYFEKMELTGFVLIDKHVIYCLKNFGALLLRATVYKSYFDFSKLV
jgi:hypothetical protein